MTRRIDISYKTVIFITVFLLLLWITYQILDIILLLFVSFIFMSALAPLVDKLVEWRIPKVAAVLLILISIIAILTSLLTIGLAPFIAQTSSLILRLDEAIAGLSQIIQIDQSVIQDQLSKLSGEIVSITVNVFKDFISFVSVLVITIYMLLDKVKIEEYLTSFFGTRQEKARGILRMIEEKLGAWLRGQLVLSLAVGALVYIGLLILGVDYALPLAILAAFLEVIPVIGPIISALPAILIALTVSPILAAFVTGLYFAIQQLEGHLIVPQVMKRAVGLNPILVILAISVGGRLLGIGGALLAVPIAVVIQLVIQEGIKIEKEIVPQI